MALGWTITFDCTSAALLAGFWKEVLGYSDAPPPEGFDSWEQWLVAMEVPEEEWSEDEGASIVDPESRGARIVFLKVPEPKRAKNRLHIDVDASSGRAVPLEERKRQVDTAVERAVGFGATRVQAFEQGDHYHVVMRDPEGNEFCLR
jgi:hypothetical protein